MTTIQLVLFPILLMLAGTATTIEGLSTNNKPTITSTVNFHINKFCNMRCKFCFATFQDVMQDTGVPSTGLSEIDAMKVVQELCKADFVKINFAGGEPLYRKDLFALLAMAKESGLTTTIVTNGQLITQNWVNSAKGLVDQVGISVDSSSSEIRLRMGRAHLGVLAMTNEEYVERATMLRQAGISLKINSVITAENYRETLTPFIGKLRPDRWKIFQALQIDGQNNLDATALACSDAMYAEFRAHNSPSEIPDTHVIFEDNAAMTGSYAMVDPYGRFFDNTQGYHHYSAPIWKVGVVDAYSEVAVDHEKFHARGGEYDIH